MSLQRRDRNEFVRIANLLALNSDVDAQLYIYPDREELFKEIRKVKNHVIVDAYAIAREIGSPKVSNMVMLGAASEHVGISLERLEGGVKSLFGRKGEEVVRLNIKAINAGKNGVKS